MLTPSYPIVFISLVFQIKRVRLELRALIDELKIDTSLMGTWRINRAAFRNNLPEAPGSTL